jgi:hypothetical protein
MGANAMESNRVFLTFQAAVTDGSSLETIDYLLKPSVAEQVTEAANRLLSYLRLLGSGSMQPLRPQKRRVLFPSTLQRKAEPFKAPLRHQRLPCTLLQEAFEIQSSYGTTCARFRAGLSTSLSTTLVWTPLSPGKWASVGFNASQSTRQ